MNIDESRDSNFKAGAFREHFDLPLSTCGTPTTYMCSHSLGPMPKAVRTVVNQELDAWSSLSVLGHTEGKYPWIKYQDRLGATIAQLVGAKDGEAVVMNTLTTNLHLMLVSFYRPDRERRAILIEENAFPSDRYAIESQIRFHGGDPERDLITVAASPSKGTIDLTDIESSISQNSKRIALILWPGVQYLTGQRFDVKAIAKLAHSVGAFIGFDLAHAIGNVPLAMHDSEADFAVWCGYKYLCGGPGTSGGCFIHNKHGEHYSGPRFSGWWGNREDNRFQMLQHFDPIRGAKGWQLSSPTVFALAPLVASLGIFSQAPDMHVLYDATVELTRVFVTALLATTCSKVPIKLITPLSPEHHGSQISIRVPQNSNQGRKIFRHLLNHNVIVDWREPDVIRFSMCPLYNTKEDCIRAADILTEARFAVAQP